MSNDEQEKNLDYLDVNDTSVWTKLCMFKILTNILKHLYKKREAFNVSKFLQSFNVVKFRIQRYIFKILRRLKHKFIKISYNVILMKQMIFKQVCVV